MEWKASEPRMPAEPRPELAHVRRGAGTHTHTQTARLAQLEADVNGTLMGAVKDLEAKVAEDLKPLVNKARTASRSRDTRARASNALCSRAEHTLPYSGAATSCS